MCLSNKAKLKSIQVSGGSRIFKRGGGGHKIMDTCCLLEHNLTVPQNNKVGGRWSKIMLLKETFFSSFFLW